MQQIPNKILSYKVKPLNITTKTLKLDEIFILFIIYQNPERFNMKHLSQLLQKDYNTLVRLVHNLINKGLLAYQERHFYYNGSNDIRNKDYLLKVSNNYLNYCQNNTDKQNALQFEYMRSTINNNKKTNYERFSLRGI